MVAQVVNHIGVTEGADPTVNLNWMHWVESGKPAVLITKMPRLLIPLIPSKSNIMVHCTITGWGGTRIEPNIDTYKTSLLYYRELCNSLGSERVVLRVDPIVQWNESFYAEQLLEIVAEARGRVRVSFLDLYPHVRERFAVAGVELQQGGFHQSLESRLRIWELLGKPEVCAEPGLPVTPCVGERECEVLGVVPSTGRRGQRSLCGCLANKVELCRRPPKCTYGCLYCYWR